MHLDKFPIQMLAIQIPIVLPLFVCPLFRSCLNMPSLLNVMRPIFVESFTNSSFSLIAGCSHRHSCSIPDNTWWLHHLHEADHKVCIATRFLPGLYFLFLDRFPYFSCGTRIWIVSFYKYGNFCHTLRHPVTTLVTFTKSWQLN